MCYAPDRNYSKSHPHFADTISSKPTGKSDYSGFYIMSGLDGQLKYALRYRKGIKQFRVRPVTSSTRSSASSKSGDKDNRIHSLFTLVIKAQTRSTGGHYGIEAGEGEWKCPFCNEIFEEDSYEFYNHECDGAECEEDPGDDEDDEPDNEDRQEKEDDDNDSGNHGGGGGGGSGNGNGSSSNTNRHKSGEPYSYSIKDIRLKNQKFSGYMDSQSTNRSCFVCNIRNLCIIYDEYNTYKFSEMSEKSFIQQIANYDKSAIYDDGAVPTQYIPDIAGIWFNYEVWDNNSTKLNFIVDAINSEYPVLTYFPTLDDSNHLIYHNVIIIGYNPDYYYLVARDPNTGGLCYYNVNDLNYANYIIKIKNLK